jgi:AcrR family transcriptional regulator
MPAADLNPPPATNTWARRRTRVASHIERAALELFAVYGPDNVTVEQIAEAAEISVRTFFRYFPTRDEVMYALPRRLVGVMCTRVAARPASESVLEAFIGAVRGQDSPVDDDLVRLWGEAVRHWAVAKSEPQPNAPMVAAYGEVIATRIGVPMNDVRVEVMATAIASVMWLAFLRWLGSDGARPLVVVVEECFKVLADLDRHAGMRAGRAKTASKVRRR